MVATVKASGKLFYEVSGRIVESDLPLPQLAAAEAEAPAVTIRRLAGPEAASGELVSSLPGQPSTPALSLYFRDDAYVWHYEGVADFVLSRRAPRIRWWSRDGNLDDVAALLAGPVLGFGLQLQGLTSLHANAVVHRGRALAITAPSGYGKSTLASALMSLGRPLLTDDVLALELQADKVWALPSIPRLKLWPDSVAHLLEPNEREELPQYVSWADKLVVEPAVLGNVYAESVPLGAVFLLAPSPPDTAPVATRLHGTEALLALLACTSRAQLLAHEPALQAKSMEIAHAIASSVPVFVFSFPRSLNRLPEIAQKVLAIADDPDRK